MEWITIKGGIAPAPFEEVLLCVDGFDIPIQGCYDDFTECFHTSSEVICAQGGKPRNDLTNYIPYYVTHWMPLPELPKER